MKFALIIFVGLLLIIPAKADYLDELKRSGLFGCVAIDTALSGSSGNKHVASGLSRRIGPYAKQACKKCADEAAELNGSDVGNFCEVVGCWSGSSTKPKESDCSKISRR